jgi:hypothetical protein
MQTTYTVSTWNAEIKKVQQQRQATMQERYTALKEFKDSLCDLFSMADFHYYAERIGCNVSYVLNIAKFSTDKDYRRPPRDINFRYQFYRQHGHSITKPLF